MGLSMFILSIRRMQTCAMGLALVVLLSACVPLQNFQNAAPNTVGAALAPTEPPLSAVLADTLLGESLIASVGEKLNNMDVAYYNYASQRALETLKTRTAAEWKNPETGVNGVVTPDRTFQHENGRYCREYRQRIEVSGKPYESAGTACRNPEGIWEVMAAPALIPPAPAPTR
ncbi:MAG: 17 kD surface antigen [Rickettsiales bacterium]|nr:17 kD surface antigen [Rickettsiales bacterium]